ncbi:MAG TPA: AraC family transcriptional regulator [Pseudogracilibacillus sp.]|nr:AraC family transcriptional regulator [Pseudogracilibacillus sp.]
MLRYNTVIKSHLYWEEKVSFELQEDTYDSWVLFCLESGSFTYEIGNETGTVRSHEMLYCPPHTSFKRKEHGPMALHFISFTFHTSNGSTANNVSLPRYHFRPLDKVRVASNYIYLRRLHLSIDEKSHSYKQWIVNDLWRLTCYEGDSVPKQYNIASFPTTTDEQMNQAMEWLLHNAHLPIGIRELARYINLSPVQLTRRFQDAFHLLPSEALRSIRMERAVKLLLNTEEKIDHIAKQCGYDNGFYFSKVFRKYIGIPPSKFRKKNRL